MSKKLYEETNIQDIADAIREKNGSQNTYTVAQMGDAVRAIHADPVLESLSVTENGNYLPSAGKDGFSEVAVAVPNSYTNSDEGKVVKNGTLVAQTARATAITENGTYDTTENDEVMVNVSGGESVIQPLSVTANGTYNPPSGVDGYAPVTVEVEGGGGTSLFSLYSLFLPENLTNSGWTDPSSGKSITLNAGAWQVEDGKLVADGSYYSFNVPNSDCLVQCALTIDPNFTPRIQADWWNQSALFGTELPSYQDDLCATIVEDNGALYPSIGSGRSGYTKGTIPITKGTEHVISLAHIYTKYFLYVDGALSASLEYTPSGTRISSMGLFWNKDSSLTAVIGTISKLGVWTIVPTTAPVIPNF